MNTRHADVRAQQRAVPMLIVDLLLQFGAAEKAGGGTRKLFFNKATRRKVMAYAGSLCNSLQAHFDTYIVVDDNESVITIGHRTQRIRRA